MKYTVSILAMAVLAGVFYDPRPAFAQNKDILQLQRDIYDVTKALTDLKAGQTEQTAQIQAQLKQVMDTNAKLSADVRDLQQKLASHQTDQQKLVIEPLAATKKSVDDLWRDVSAVQSNVNTIRTDQKKMGDSLTNVSGQIGLMQSKAAEPATNPADAPALAFAAAQQEKLTGSLQLALGDFEDISKKYSSSSWAPLSLFEMGGMYAQNGQYQDALNVYDRVLEQFGENPVRKQAQFQKAVQLANLNRKSDAAKEYDSFARLYPGDDNAPIALQRARELRGGGTTPAKGKQKGR
jgi:TolA-binding protein